MDKYTAPGSGRPVTLTRNEYRLLVSMVYQNVFMHESVVNQENSRLHEEMSDLAEKLIGYAEEFNSTDLVAEDVVNNVIYPSTDFYESVLAEISKYDEISFWEELTQRLAERDVLRDHKPEDLQELTSEEYMVIVSERLAWYADHFGNNGLDDLEVMVGKSLKNL